MPAQPENKEEKAACLVAPGVIKRLDAVAAKLAPQGAGALSRSQAMRAVLMRGLSLYEGELGLELPAKAKRG